MLEYSQIFFLPGCSYSQLPSCLLPHPLLRTCTALIESLPTQIFRTNEVLYMSEPALSSFLLPLPLTGLTNPAFQINHLGR